MARQTSFRATIDDQGRLTIPSQCRAYLGVDGGDTVDAEITHPSDDGEE